MSSAKKMKIVLGLVNVGDGLQDSTVRYSTPDDVNAYLNAFHAHGGRTVDTARNYSPHAPGSCEEKLGTVAAGERFAIDTKVVSFIPRSHTKAKIQESVDTSLQLLKAPINVEYLHVPDRTTPFEETIEAMDQAYRAGKFKYFGISNFKVDEVETVMSICEERGFVKPSVYQGQYNAIVRGGEKELFAVLRKYGIAFYAWSPAAAGLFAGNHKNVKSGDRFDSAHAMGQLYASGYLKDKILTAVDKAIEVFAKHGINGHAAALRWVVHHSSLEAAQGDALVISASSVAQLESNFDYIDQGPLPDEVVEALNKVYPEVAGSEFPYHY